MSTTPKETVVPSSKFGDIPSGEFCVYGKVHAHAEHADALEELYREMTVIAATEPGVIHYCLARDTADPTIFHFFERYASRKHFEAHVAAEGSQKAMSSGWMRDVEARFEKPIM